MAWQDKVKEAIAHDCLIAYKQANNGRKRRVPYVVPDISRAMVAALNSDDEAEGKRLLLIWRAGAVSLV